MTVQTDRKKTDRETPLKARIRVEIDAGISESRDPQNAGLPDLYRRTTTMYSPWYTRACPECKHNFREGDRVLLCPRCGQAYHDDDRYNLHCWQEHFADGKVCKKDRYDHIAERQLKGCDYVWSGKLPEEEKAGGDETQPTRRIARVTSQFLQGLERLWKPFGEETVKEIEEGSPIVGHKCPWCRFQIRAGDRVVKCPCGDCETYFHDDIFRHLTCWDDWNGSQGNNYCPTTGARIERTLPSTEEEG